MPTGKSSKPSSPTNKAQVKEIQTCNNIKVFVKVRPLPTEDNDDGCLKNGEQDGMVQYINLDRYFVSA
jgi:hypothetical protein